MAAAAAPEVRALRRYTIRRGIEHFECAGAYEAGLLLHDFGAHALARQDVGHQNDTALRTGPGNACQAFTAVDQLLDRNLEIAYDRDYSADGPRGQSYFL